MGQRVLQRSRIAQVTYFFVLLTVIAESFIAFVITAIYGPSSCRAKSFSFGNRRFVQCAVLVFVVARTTTEMSITFKRGDLKARKCERRVGHAVATRLVAGVRNVTCTRYVAPFTRIYSSRRSTKVNDQVTMSFDIVIK